MDVEGNRQDDRAPGSNVDEQSRKRPPPGRAAEAQKGHHITVRQVDKHIKAREEKRVKRAAAKRRRYARAQFARGNRR